MAEREPTPTPISSPLTRPVNPSSRDEMAKHVLPHLTSQVSNQSMLELLGRGQDRSDSKLQRFPTPPPFPDKGRTSVVCNYLNRISAFFKEKEEPASSATTPSSIQFLEIPDNAPLDNPTLTPCRPDVAILKQSPQQVHDPTKLYWSQLEATGEDESSGKRKAEVYAQGASYAGYLLLARPDYISVPGIFFNAQHFKLFLTNACQCYATGLIAWDSAIAQRLLYTWFWRLHHPEADKTIEIHHKPSGTPTFTVHTDGNVAYKDCYILSTGGPFGRRTTIFDASSVVIKGTTSDAGGVVIKEQFIEVGQRFTEGPILEKIHNYNKGVLPGVVRVGWHGAVKSDGNDIELKEEQVVTRTKKRLVLLDKAASLMRVHTPREFLMAIYDVLETTRILWRKYTILHRDISSNNVLLRDESKVVTPSEPLSNGLGDMCFSEYLLRARMSPPLSPLSENTEASESVLPQAKGLSPSPPLLEKGSDSDLARLSTRVVLIDFDMSEDQTPVPGRTEEPKDRTGTPIFMARAVRSGRRRAGFHSFHSMPQLDVARDAYRESVGGRLESFPPLGDESYHAGGGSPLSPFQHKLRYDAESVFWLFLWWSLQIKPQVKQEHENYIPMQYWSLLTGAIDLRDHFFLLEFPENLLHPEYQPLERLLKQMASQLTGDHELLPSRQHDEYLHEAFQRLILEFLFANYNEPFMTLKTHDQFRKVDPDVMSQGSRTSTKRKLDGDYDARRRKRPHYVP